MDQISLIARLLRYYSIVSTSSAGSGHLTSCLSSADLMSVLFAGGHFRFDIANPQDPRNDRIIFSKGHAAPLLYALWCVAGAVSAEELLTLRKFGSRLEGHPTMRFPYAEVPTGSLGQGLAVGAGMALSAQYLDNLDYRTYVLLGDGEMAEGSVWETMQVAAHYKLHNLTGIIDVNKFGQQCETMMGYDLQRYEDKVRSFGWYPLVIDGHDIGAIQQAFTHVIECTDRPTMIIAKTIKGKGVSFLEHREDMHAKALDDESAQKALQELQGVDTSLTVTLPRPNDNGVIPSTTRPTTTVSVAYPLGDMTATREAYGHTVGQLASADSRILVLDGDLSNSTNANVVKHTVPRQFFEMFIAEQNMVGMATGLAIRGKIPFVSTYAAFLSRAHDQIRMAGYGRVNLKIIGSHGGVSLGQDGFSQMGLEDIASMRAILDSVVLYPSDAVSTARLVTEMAKYQGLAYLRTTRGKTPTLYSQEEDFTIGGCKVHYLPDRSYTHVIVGAGITLHEALEAQKILADRGCTTVVVDLYSIKPLDVRTLSELAQGAQSVLVVEDHYPEGGIGEAVRTALGAIQTPVISLAVNHTPQSGTPEELLRYEQIDTHAIVSAILRSTH